ncbi:polar amino acid transport system substrate-binding protein [Candidatus Magnetomoraceae bacterium gMMP-15]
MKLKITALIIIAFCVLLIPCVLMGQDIKKINLSEDPFPPYTLGVEGAAPTGGIAVEIISEIFNRLNIEVDMQLYPWNRCLAQMKVGRRDGLMMVIKTPEREEYMAFTESLIKDHWLFYFLAGRKSPIEWNTYEDMKPYKIGITAGYGYGDEFLNAAEKFSLQIDEVKTDLHNFKKLLAKRTDVFICLENVANKTISMNPELKGKFKTACKSLWELEMYMTFSKKSPAVKLLPQVNKIIRQMREDGTMDKILGSGER